MHIFTQGPRKLFNIPKRQNSWGTISKPLLMRKMRKKNKILGTKQNISNLKVNLKKNKSFMNKKREIYAPFSWN